MFFFVSGQNKRKQHNAIYCFVLAVIIQREYFALLFINLSSNCVPFRLHNGALQLINNVFLWPAFCHYYVCIFWFRSFAIGSIGKRRSLYLQCSVTVLQCAVISITFVLHSATCTSASERLILCVWLLAIEFHYSARNFIWSFHLTISWNHIGILAKSDCIFHLAESLLSLSICRNALNYNYPLTWCVPELLI